jgi:hypothetical protein
MASFLGLLLHALASPFKSQARLEAEIVFLRHQLNLLRRRLPARPRLTPADRLLFVWLYRLVPSLLNAAVIIQPDTIVRWHRAGFRSYWRWKSRLRGGRPKVPAEVRSLIRRMSLESSLWGAPRIHGELLKLGIEVAQSTVAKYMAKHRPGSGQTWKTFLRNHVAGIGAMDFFVVPTINFRLLFVLVILRHERRQLISLSVTNHPTAEWIARQINEAFPWDSAPTLLRPCRYQTSSSDGHSGSPDCAAVTLAERTCGEADWLDPSRMPGSHRDLWRGPSASGPQGLCRLLQPCPDASIIGQGRTSCSSHSTVRAHRCDADTRRTSSSILPDVVLGTDRLTYAIPQITIDRARRPSMIEGGISSSIALMQRVGEQPWH